jgi:SAM-dependent methyltransferase
MSPQQPNRFEDFFADDAYVRLKNHLYNYRLRKRAVNRCLEGLEKGLILEIGSGLSPMVTGTHRVIYSELSFPALLQLKKGVGHGAFVVADATHLPFKEGVFAQVVCSEVIEHLPDDRSAIPEMVKVMKQRGNLLLTFPHRKGYFAADDRLVNHYRRYELSEMEAMLSEAGLQPIETIKVLGPLEKAMMILVAWVVLGVQRVKKTEGEGRQGNGALMPAGLLKLILPVFVFFNDLLCLPLWFDAWLMPRSLSAVLLVRSSKG